MSSDMFTTEVKKPYEHVANSTKKSAEKIDVDELKTRLSNTATSVLVDMLDVITSSTKDYTIRWDVLVNDGEITFTNEPHKFVVTIGRDEHVTVDFGYGEPHVVVSTKEQNLPDVLHNKIDCLADVLREECEGDIPLAKHCYVGWWDEL